MIKRIVVSMTLLAVLALGVLSPSFASAQSPFSASKQEVCKGANLGSGGTCDSEVQRNRVNRLIGRVINILSIIVGIVAVIMIIIYGLRFITSGGDSNAVAAARNGLIYAFVGLAVAAFAQLIVKFVIKSL
jgi:hypothetical protein